MRYPSWFVGLCRENEPQGTSDYAVFYATVTPFEKGYNDFEILVKSDLSTERAQAKLRMDKVSLTGAEIYICLQSVWKNRQMLSFAEFLKWYRIKDVVPTLDAMQEKIECYHNKGIGTSKLECTPPNLANMWLY